MHSLGEYFDEFTHRDWQTRDPTAVSDTVRIAVVGLGWFTREWALPGIERSGFTEATVAIDIDPDAVATVADEHDLIGLTPEKFRNGVASEAYDAVYVATPNATHLEYAEIAADQGAALLCEKPLEASLDRARRLVTICDDADIPLMVGYRMQTDPAVRRLKELLRGDFIGDVLHIHGTMSQTMLGELGEETGQWRLDPDLSGGCALMDIGIYPLNTTRFILDADPTEVYGHTRSAHDPFEEVDEHATFQLRFPDDVRALCSVSQNAQHASRLEITGTDGQLILDPAFYEREARELTLVRDGVESEIEFDPVHQLEEEFAYFGHHLLTDTNFVPDGEHALADMRVLDAVYESAATGTPIAVE
ncbi:D-xylose 1-dehydrogenase Gfo6 [Halapricum hydrolyticum]|uniref:Gfo/Idh/MocA family oxidoreductase n=1 Tax=Halapricum hydrolyticum TaxID=2979991 RepID=A0AAE3LHX7_9EURY|nr:D-xylose 1-dehydrogenase Gfo6 [Halapricum hydrolyticum]MCU4719159.1 Gfo/Idh/MocA family oxidoreductase [Halapricum hydrolyticum]MCU4727349.1 Gfo/Idh/MocA family oxidoreductase [Halapricum hydrolyticum]